MIIDIVLSLVGVVSVVYLLSLIRGSFTREKEKVDEFNPWGSGNQPIWVAGNLRQRHTPELILPRPFIPSNISKLPITPHDPAVDGLQQSDQPHQRRKSEPSEVPFYQYKSNLPPPINGASHLDQPKEQSGLLSVPEHPRGLDAVPPLPLPTRPSDNAKPATPVGGIRGTAPIRLLPVNVSSLETLYPPPPVPPPQPDPITAPRGGGGGGSSTISPNMYRRKSLKQSTNGLIDNPQLSSSSSSSRSTSPKHQQYSGRSFSDSSSSLVSIDMKDLTLQHVLGGGAFGQVWQAMWKSTPVAVKVLSSTCGSHSNEDDLRAFNDEVQMLAHLRHPNICLFLGASLKPPNRFIVTELISRGSLWDALRKPNIFNVSPRPSSALLADQTQTQGQQTRSHDSFHWPWWAIRRVLDGTCRGLVYLHSHDPPIIHRDLKSANLLLDDSFHVKVCALFVPTLSASQICDFGLARLRDMSANYAMTANVGTTQVTPTLATLP
jgi:hypothetical protein